MTIKRQHNVNGYRLDAYIPELNIALEYDEKKHLNNKNKKADKQRQLNIEDILGCKFIRLLDTKTNKENIETVFNKIEED